MTILKFSNDTSNPSSCEHIAGTIHSVPLVNTIYNSLYFTFKLNNNIYYSIIFFS